MKLYMKFRYHQLIHNFSGVTLLL